VKTVLTLTTDDLLSRLGLDSAPTVPGSLNITRLCIHTDPGAWEIFFEINPAEAVICLPSLRTTLADRTCDSVQHVILRPTYLADIPVEQYLYIHWSDLCFEISLLSQSLLSFLDPCKWQVSNGLVQIQVSSDMAVQALRDRGCCDLISTCIKRDTKEDCTVEFIAGDFSSVIKENLQQRQEESRRKALVIARETAQERKRIVFKSGSAQPQTPVSIFELLQNPVSRKKATISGKVIKYRPANGDFRRIDRFILTDYTSSIDCFPGNPKNGNGTSQPSLDIEEGEWLTVAGTLDRNFKDEFQFKADYIERIDSPVPNEDYADHRIELHAHSKMSAMDGLTDVTDLIHRAADWHHSAIGITDHGNVHAFPEFFGLGKKRGIKTLLGMEGYLANHDSGYVADRVRQKEQGTRAFSRDEMHAFKQKVHHIIIYAANSTGLRNLYDLVSLSHTDYFYNRPLIPRDVLLAHRDGLLIGSACERGEIYQLVLSEYLGKLSPDEFTAQITEAIALYDYLEIQPLANNLFYVSKAILKSEKDLKNINRRIYDLGKQYGKPVVATGDVHVLEEQDTLLRRVLQAGQGYDKESDESDTPLYLKPTHEMLEEFSYLGEDAAREVVIDNPAAVVAGIEDIIPIPDGFHPPKLDGAEDELRQLCYARAKELYGESLHPLVEKRLDRELHDIITNHFADLYMLAQKVVKKSLDDGYIVGSRGSVGSSFVAYLSGITEVNSLPPHYACPRCSFTQFIHYDDTGNPRSQTLDGIDAEVGVDLPKRTCPKCNAEMHRYGFDIPFETFVGFKGDKTPDIDLNFASEYQPRAHRYVEELFGKENVYRAGTISTLKDRTAFGFVKKYLEQADLEWPRAEIDRVVQGLTGIKRTTGQHPGGMIILPTEKSITEFCPVQYPANKSSAPNKTTHFDYHAMEDQLLKLDILGHDDPTQIRLLTEYLGKDITGVPLDDRKMLSIFSSVKALGVSSKAIGSKVGTYAIPEFGTDFVRGMLEDTRPKTFADLIRISGLSHGTDVWLNNARNLIKNSVATLKNVICTRDDIMHDLISKGLEEFTAFKIMEQVRKGKGLTPEDVEVMRAHDVPEWYIDSCQKIKYMFPKAHAVAYVLNAARIAYCKVHHPVEFYATYFTVMRHRINAMTVAGGRKAISDAINELASKGRRQLTANDQATLVVLEVALEMTERGITMLPIDVYKSDPARCIIEDGKIIPPFTAFPGLGDSVAVTIIEARQAGPFTSREDFQRRTSCNRTVVDALAAVGILGDLPASDQMDMWEMAAEPSPSKPAAESALETAAPGTAAPAEAPVEPVEHVAASPAAPVEDQPPTHIPVVKSPATQSRDEKQEETTPPKSRSKKVKTSDESQPDLGMDLLF
jgi:DNA polymerase-3 subunit alpha (Gram-positive type)